MCTLEINTNIIYQDLSLYFTPEEVEGAGLSHSLIYSLLENEYDYNNILIVLGHMVADWERRHEPYTGV